MSTKTAKPIDRRVARTRRLLRESLVELILERGWDRVSVQDVCARADVGRSTFYSHFADKEELLISGFDELKRSLHEARRASGGSFAFAEPLLEHARDNHRLFRAVIGKRSGQAVQERFRRVVIQLVEDELEPAKLAEVPRSVVVHYLAGAFVEILMWWLERPSSMRAAEVAASFRSLTRGVVSAAR